MTRQIAGEPHYRPADRLPGVVSDRADVLRDHIDAAIAENDGIGAGALLERLWSRHPGPATANFVLTRTARLPADPSRRHVTLAVLRSFTLEPVVPVVRAAAAVSGIDLDVHLGDFGTYGQDMLDAARPLHKEWNPDVVIVATQTRDVAPELWDRFADLRIEDVDKAIDQVIDQFTALVEGFRRLSDATLVLHGFEEPPFTALGVGDRALGRSQRQAIRSLNERLGQVADAHPGVHVLDYDSVVARAGRLRWLDENKWLTMRMPIRAEHLADLAAEWMRFVQPATDKIAKALVVDLDGTMWGGVLGEDGVDGIDVGASPGGAGYRSLQRTLLDLTARGVLLGICSKNNEADVVEVLETHPDLLVRRDHFAAVRINWESKVDNLRSIADELNIGLDSVAFLDDNPFECDLVRRSLPQVTVIELDRPPTSSWNPIIGNPLFERPRLVAEDRRRSDYYVEQARRRDALEHADSLESYLHGIGTVVTVAEATAGDIPRVAQLTQKTNQFNLTTRRYGEAQIRAFVDSPDTAVLVARAEDRFGDHGLVGVVIVDMAGPAWEMDTMLLSCRVIGRGIETAVMSVVLAQAARAGARAFEGMFVPTAKNLPARDFFSSAGFEPIGAVDDDTATPVDATRWRWNIGTRTFDAPAWIVVRDSTGAVIP
jgi:FkbH-like protein